MNKSLSNRFTQILAVIGLIVALILTLGEHISSSVTGCFRNGDGCAVTTGSVYGHVGPVPTAGLGLLMYIAFIALCQLRGKSLRLARDREAARAAAYASSTVPVVEEASLNDEERQAVHAPEPVSGGSVMPRSVSMRPLDATVWGLALVGFGASIWLQYVSIYQLHNFCKYCFTSAVLVTLILAFASRDFLLDGRKLTGEQKMIGGVLTLIVVLIGFMIFPDVWVVITHPMPLTGPQPMPDARGVITASMLHSKGNPNAKYTVVEFADYQCSHCAQAVAEVEKLLKPRENDIRFVFRNSPLPNHQWAHTAAAAAEAAGEQGKFWEMHDLLFEHQKDLDTPLFSNVEFDNFARTLRLDIAKFDKDRMSNAIEARVKADEEASIASHVLSTPTFFFISPSHVTSIPGTIELGKFLNKPTAKEWQ